MMDDMMDRMMGMGALAWAFGLAGVLLVVVIVLVVVKLTRKK
jgi:hypothetical protein